MIQKKYWGIMLAGTGAGIVNGLFGAGGGMVLVPLLTTLGKLPEEEAFPSSVCIILPICLITLSVSLHSSAAPLTTALPYLIGSTAGGVLAGLLGQKIPTLWLHRLLGILIIWGGIRYLC